MPGLTSSLQDTYGVLPETVMSGRDESAAPREIGWPLLASSKLLPSFTSRATKICLTPRTVSSQATHGTVALAGFMVPPATRGSSASCSGFVLSEHRSSFSVDLPQRFSLFSTPLSWLPTTVQ